LGGKEKDRDKCWERWTENGTKGMKWRGYERQRTRGIMRDGERGGNKRAKEEERMMI